MIGKFWVDWWVVVLLMVGLSFCARILGLHGSDEGDVREREREGGRKEERNKYILLCIYIILICCIRT